MSEDVDAATPLVRYEKTDLVAMITESQRVAERLWSRDGGDEVSELPLSPDHGWRPLGIQAPMVRCSRPPFRHLCRLYGTDISYTHMILAEPFSRSASARSAEMALYKGETRLVVQMTSKDPCYMGLAAPMVERYCDAIDLNCGCPQRWAISEGIGSALMENPQLISELVRSVRNNTGGAAGSSPLPCVVKMRVFDDVARTVDLARQIEAAGASWLTVHGRTAKCPPSCPIRIDTINVIRDALRIPLVVNGGMDNYDDALNVARACRVGATMTARGLLANPAMYMAPGALRHVCSDASATIDLTDAAAVERWEEEERDAGFRLQRVGGNLLAPLPVVCDFLRLSVAYNAPVRSTLQHLLLMAEKRLSPMERIYVSQQRSLVGILTAVQDAGLWTDRGLFCPSAASGAGGDA